MYMLLENGALALLCSVHPAVISADILPPVPFLAKCALTLIEHRKTVRYTLTKRVQGQKVTEMQSFYEGLYFMSALLKSI